MVTEKAINSRSPAKTSPPETASGTAKPRVLLAEDNQVNQAIVTEMLEYLGYGVDTADDGREAVESAVRRTYALILMDCQMPELDGYDSSREIRAAEAEGGRTRAPIVALTGNIMAGEREKCLAAGMDDYLSKPFTLGQLQEMCMKWIGGR